VTRRLAAGQLDLALNVTENTILNSEQGGRLEIIAGNVNRLPFSFIARPHIKTYADLRGARIGVSSLRAGSSSLVMQLLAGHGLHYPQDYTLLAVGPILARWDKLRSGEIDGGLQGAPLNYIAVDAGFSDLGSPRSVFPDFQFTSLDADSYWAKQNRDTVVAFLRAYLQAHRWFYANPAGATDIAVRETGVEKRYAERAWKEYARDGIFPRDGAASAAAVQALIEVSALIRDLAVRSKSRAEQYINPAYLEEARLSFQPYS
ncbi:MAG TPA: ABC transporter substrate-binding protein, partial [Burkholderiales bacterium]|nr:ABC transporter substrate-binding protein [Burkholderiales bacterium]